MLVQGKGLHKLELKLTAPLQTAAAQQTLQLTLPTIAATRLKLTVPGNIDVKGGRGGRSAARMTWRPTARVLELLPQRGGMAVVMSLNNRLLQDQRVFVARSVIVDEVTQGYERIHATISYRVLHGAVEKLRLAVPAGFEVTQGRIDPARPLGREGRATPTARPWKPRSASRPASRSCCT